MVKQLKLVLLSFLIGSSMAAGFVDPLEQAFKSKKPVVVMFTKSRCPYCIWLRPLFNRLKDIYDFKALQYFIIDIGNNQSYYTKKYRLRTVPTVIYFDMNGKELVRHGSNNKGIPLSQMQAYAKRALLL